MQPPTSSNIRRLITKCPQGLLAVIGLLACSSAAHSAISLNGAAVINAKDLSGVNVANGSLGILIVDVQGDGFAGLSSGASGALDSSDDPGVTEGRAGLEIGNHFGGETVLARLTAIGAPLTGGSFSMSLPSLDISPYLGKAFAIVWFDQIQTATSPANAPEGSHYGVVSGSDWILPGVDAGSYTFSSIDGNGSSSYYQVNLTNNPPAAVGLRTTNGSGVTAASFTVVPEPSSLLIACIGMLCQAFVRRRR